MVAVGESISELQRSGEKAESHLSELCSETEQAGATREGLVATAAYCQQQIQQLEKSNAALVAAVAVGEMKLSLLNRDHHAFSVWSRSIAVTAGVRRVSIMLLKQVVYSWCDKVRNSRDSVHDLAKVMVQAMFSQYSDELKLRYLSL